MKIASNNFFMTCVFWVKHMQISQNYNMKSNLTVGKGTEPTFGSLLRFASRENCRMDSYFFRGTDALDVVIKELKDKFPNGGKIYDFACSDGEEAITLMAMLGKNDLQKYKINCYDVCLDAINLARKGVYSVFSGLGDDFLLDGEALASKSDKKKKFFELFHSIMIPTVAPKYSLSNTEKYFYVKSVIPDFKEKYFTLKPAFKKLLNFEFGDIRALNNIEPDEKVSAILFRNAFYHLYDNEIMKIFNGKKLDNYSCGEKDKQKIVDSLIDKIHKKLEVGGTFTIGDYFSEHAFLANKFVANSDKEKFINMPFFSTRFEKFKNLFFMKKSPIVKALERDGRFIPIHSSPVTGYPLNKPFSGVTVWQKVK